MMRLAPAALFALTLHGLLAGCARADSEPAGCVPTAADSLGPYYVAGTAMTEDLNRFGQPGEALIVSGEIRSAGAGEAGIDGARIEVWQTDGEGRYHPQGSGDVADYPSDAVDLRGTVVTDEAGVYRYRTVVPGAYPPRPRHFHYRITAPGHQTLVTQLYVSADAAGRQSGGDCRHAPIEAGEGGLTYRAPALYLQPG